MQTFGVGEMFMAVLIVSAIFALVMIGLSIRANARFRQEKELPMQWLLTRSEPLSRSVVRTAPRAFVSSLTPFLAICTLALFNVVAMTLTPRPGQEGMLFPSLIFIGSVFVAAHVFHLRLIGKTLRRNGHTPACSHANMRASKHARIG